MLEVYKLWAIAEDGVHEVHLYARVELLSNFMEDTFHTHFFNARQLQIPFLGCISVNMSVEFLDVSRTTQQVRSRVSSWTKNIFVHSWGPYPTMIPHTVSTITRRAYNVPVTPHDIVLRANHERFRLKRVDWRRTCRRELLARIVNTCVTRFVLSGVLPCPMILMTAGSRDPTPIDKVLIPSTM